MVEVDELVVELLPVVEVVEEGFCVVLVVVEDVEVLVVVDGQTGSKLSGIVFNTQFIPCT